MIRACCLCLLLSGCVGSFQNIPGDTNPAHSSRCGNLDAKHRVGLTVASIGAGSATVLGTSAGLEAKDHSTTARALALSGGIVGAIGVGMGLYGIDAGNTYQQLCTQPTLPVVPK
jgi:hypothetical protein